MRLVTMIAVGAIGAVLGSGVAAAACKDDVQEFAAKVKMRPKEGDRTALRKELAKAQELSNSDEVGCINALARARKAFAMRPDADSAAEQSVQPVQPLNQK